MKNEPSPDARHRIGTFPTRLTVYGLLFFVALNGLTVSTAQAYPPLPAKVEKLADRLSQHVHYLASPELKGRRFGTPGNKAAEKYIIEQFVETGLSASGPKNNRLQRVSRRIGNNVFSALTPVVAGRKWLILGAHFDHLGEEDGDIYLGADDNASSVAILLETARLLQQSPAFTQYNILFICFNSEEPPNFLTKWMGSNQFMQRTWEAGLEESDIGLAVIMDLMGGVFWDPLRDSVFVMGAEKTPELETLLPKIKTSGLQVHPMGIHMVENQPGQGRMPFSDYDAFRNEDLPFLFLSSGRTPDYHQPTDTADKLHYTRMARSVLWLAQLFQRVDQHPTSLRFQPERENFIQDYKTIAPLVEKASVWSTTISGTGPITFFDIRQDRDRLRQIKTKIDHKKPLTPIDGYALSQASIRLQCLLGNMGPCFLIPDADNYAEDFDENVEEADEE